jgi:hypothetical protein
MSVAWASTTIAVEGVAACRTEDCHLLVDGERAAVSGLAGDALDQCCGVACD